MSIRPLLALVAAAWFCGWSLRAKSAAKLLDQVIEQPGSWDQMCSMPPPIPADVPLPLYSLAVRRSFDLSQANIAKLKARREEVVKELRTRLKAMDLNGPAPSQDKRVYSDTLSGQNPKQLSGLMLSAILELDAVETLPELLKIEAQLEAALAKAAPTDTNVFPNLDLDSPATWVSGRSAGPPKLSQQVFTARVLQRETLAVMAALLRGQKFAPLLASDMEKQFAERLKQDRETKPLKDIRTRFDLQEQDRPWILFDPVYDIPRFRTLRKGSIPYSPDLRQQIRGWAEFFVKERLAGGQ